ncbi:hypothetical protein [Lysinibacillus fusiformis]|uniref:hypothetical protein n=1 Tax=Lysinibacillus fusiformis TaxID=28031 RepID=UPI0020C1647D|nr:hypothetical protein [Lysinibacillus fusiformis]
MGIRQHQLLLSVGQIFNNKRELQFVENFKTFSRKKSHLTFTAILSTSLLFGCGNANDDQEPDPSEEPSEQQSDQNQNDSNNDHQEDNH